MKSRILLLSMIVIVACLSANQIASAQESHSDFIVPIDSEAAYNKPGFDAQGDILSTPTGVRGDVNEDGRVTIDDLSTLIDYLLLGTFPDDGAVKMKMQAGELLNGKTKDYSKRNSATADKNFWNYCHSTLLLDISNCSIIDVELKSGETLSVHWFDADCNYGGTVNSIQGIPSAAKYVRFQLSSSSPIALRDLVVTVDGTAATRKNAANPSSQSDKRTYFSFEVKKPYRFDTGVDYIGDDRLYDNGFVLLPENYSPTGEPTNLAVFIQGTSGYPFDRVNGTSAYNNYMGMYKAPQEFVALNNIAVCCCSGLTSKYGNSETNLMFAPLFCESVANMVDFVKDNYNIGKIYIYGKSSGGILCNLAPLVEEIGAVCAASLAPAFCPIASQVYHRTFQASCANIAAEELGIDYTFNKDTWNEQDRRAIYDNISQWRKFDGFFASYDEISDDDLRAIAEDAYAVGKTSLAATMDMKPRTRDIINGAKRSFPCPNKVWVSQDDNAVDWRMCALLVDRTDNYTLSFLISNGSQHHSDDGPNAETVEYTLPDGTVVTATRGYAEMVDWFKCDGIEDKK